MLKILHKGTQISLDVDPAKTALSVEAFQADATMVALVAGKLVGVNDSGYVVPADGAAAEKLAA